MPFTVVHMGVSVDDDMIFFWRLLLRNGRRENAEKSFLRYP